MRRSLSLLVGLISASALGLAFAGPAGAGGEETFVVEATTNFNSVARKDISVRCPETDHRIGGGAAINGRGSRRHVALHKSRPIENGWRAAAHETDNYHRKWSLTVRAVCEEGDKD
jgi:hypothetical protein